MNRLKELNKQINNLTKEREELLQEKGRDVQKQWRSFEWAPRCNASFQMNYPCAAGIPRFIIHLNGSIPPYSSNSICLIGNSPNYEHNLIVRFIGTTARLETSSLETLEKLLSMVSFKSFEYDDNICRIANLLKNAEVNHECYN